MNKTDVVDNSGQKEGCLLCPFCSHILGTKAIGDVIKAVCPKCVELFIINKKDCPCICHNQHQQPAKRPSICMACNCLVSPCDEDSTCSSPCHEFGMHPEFCVLCNCAPSVKEKNNDSEDVTTISNLRDTLEFKEKEINKLKAENEVLQSYTDKLFSMLYQSQDRFLSAIDRGDRLINDNRRLKEENRLLRASVGSVACPRCSAVVNYKRPGD